MNDANNVLRLWLVSQDVNCDYDSDYDTSDSAVVIAYTADEARSIVADRLIYLWVGNLKNVNVELLGIATSGSEGQQIVCASFNSFNPDR